MPDPLVAVVMGSKSDAPLMDECLATLEKLGISHESEVMSAHRTPDKVADFAKGARDRGIEVIIAAAGGAAALPVIGVPVPSSELGGIDALHGIVQMPPGVPVAAVAIGSWGARNSALLAAEILALSHDDIRSAYDDYRKALAAG
jgi:5-(carboxyamino)imidazole ribonucleotide mutase